VTPDQFARYAETAQAVHRGHPIWDSCGVTVGGRAVSVREYEGADDDGGGEDYTDHTLAIGHPSGALEYRFSYGNTEHGEVHSEVLATGLDALFQWEYHTGVQAWDTLGLEVLL
jgi:hypothetical protein